MTSVLHGPRVPYVDGDRVESLVAMAAARQPGAIALRWRDREVTYADLLSAADIAASGLAAAGIGPGDIVVVRAPRAPLLVTALLGILKTGAAYACAPVDWPEARVRQLIDQTAAKLCLTEDDIRALESDEDVPAHGLDGTAPFCVFLTSGSTGVPKAALAPHRGVVRTAMDDRQVHSGRIVSLQQMTPAWDIFALELWVPLIRGGTSVLYDGTHLTGPQLRTQIEGGVTTLAMAATLFNALVDDDIDCFTGLKVVQVGGERLSPEHVKRCLHRHPELRILNGYGPVENTISTTVWAANETEIGQEVPIGTPPPNTSVYLLDEHRGIVPSGQTGELVAAGDGLSLGYVGDETETTKRFATIDLDGALRRVYFTGDLARIENGNLVFVGRRDRQLKIRGVRIEAEEVERVIEAVPDVTRGIVVPLPLDAPAKTRLAAFYTGQGVAPELVRKAVTAALPAGFVPDDVVEIEEFPLLDNGKVDQRALADLVRGDATAARNETGLAGVLCDVASELLGYRIGADEDIFDRGATSLTAIRISTRLGTLFAKQVTVADVLAARTPRRIVEVLADAPTLPGRETRPDPSPETAYEPEHVPFTVASFWAAAQHEGHLDEAIVAIVYRLHGPVDRGLLGSALDQIVARHEVLRARFSDGGRWPKVRILPASEVAGLLQDHAESATMADAAEQASAWVMRPFDLKHELPIRAAYFPVSDTESVLAVSAHHISFDGWSGQVFGRELVDAYEGRLGAPPASFFRVAAEQRERDREQFPMAVYTKMNTLADVREQKFPLGDKLPWAGPATEIPLEIDEGLLAGVGRAASVVGGTVMAIFYAAYTRLLAEYTGVPDPAVAVPITGRFTDEAVDVIGCTASMVPLRLSTTDSHRALAEAAARELRDAMRPPLVPLAAVMPQIPDGCHRHPLLQAYLLQEEMPPSGLTFGGARAELVRVPPANAVPEITLELWPHPAVGGVLRYRTDAIGETDARRLAGLLIDNVREIVHALEED